MQQLLLSLVTRHYCCHRHILVSLEAPTTAAPGSQVAALHRLSIFMQAGQQLFFFYQQHQAAPGHHQDRCRRCSSCCIAPHLLPAQQQQQQQSGCCPAPLLAATIALAGAINWHHRCRWTSQGTGCWLAQSAIAPTICHQLTNPGTNRTTPGCRQLFIQPRSHQNSAGFQPTAHQAPGTRALCCQQQSTAAATASCYFTILLVRPTSQVTNNNNWLYFTPAQSGTDAAANRTIQALLSPIYQFQSRHWLPAPPFPTVAGSSQQSSCYYYFIIY